MFSIICAVFLFLFLLFAPSSIFVAGSSSQTSFSYDPSASNGPADWGNLAIDNNACSGNSNSPIALNSTNHCDIVGDYIFEVS
jgi:carbonic anhydrase